MRITETEARRRWEEAIRVRGWQKSKLRLVMFDYYAVQHGPTLYSPAPAWPSIADSNNTADHDAYVRIEQALLVQGGPFSQRGAARNGGGSDLVFVPNPTPIRREQIVTTVEQVMKNVHPLAITQEQILRAAFFAHLPSELSRTIGTTKAAVHPERATPSNDYVVTGKRNIGMCARYDLGFGHPSDPAGIVGVMELKSGPGSFDSLQIVSGWEESESDLPEFACEGQKPNKPLDIHLKKMLDSKLPEEALRISWFTSRKRGQSTAADIRNWTERIVERVAKQRNRSGASFHVDSATGWLFCTWPQSETRLELAWYRPTAANPENFEPVFAG